MATTQYGFLVGADTPPINKPMQIGPWRVNNIAVSQANAILQAFGVDAEAPAAYPLPSDALLLGLIARGTQGAVTAGSITFTFFNNFSALAATVVCNSSNAIGGTGGLSTYISMLSTPLLISGARTIQIKATTDGSYAPVTNDWCVWPIVRWVS